MLDVHIDGHATRISPEAPVAVMRPASERRAAGGAANVAANLAALGGCVRLVGIVGADAEAHMVCDLLAGLGVVDTSGLVTDPSRPTITKTRVASGHHQFVRIDREDNRPLDTAPREALIAAVQAAARWAQVMVISDYGKGVCADAVLHAAIAAARAAGCPVLVDPKRRDVAVYAGADLITPNRRELTEATGLPCDTDAEAERAAAAMIAITNAAVLLTRSELGMSYFAPGTPPIHLPTAAREVFDVSGAGDTVVATLALGIAAGLPMAEAMRLANETAGIVVGKIGTAVVTRAELQAALDRAAHPRRMPPPGVVALADAIRQREAWRRQGLVVGFTNGCFDLLHPGHISLLEQAAAACDRLIVALNSDASVHRLKGPSRPLQTEAARARVIGALRPVDLVLLFEQDTPLAVIEALQPDVLVKGADYTIDTVVGADVVQAAGGRVILATLEEGQSTTRLVQRMAGEPTG
ncbi:D-glycero-beta-D-manno-heptose 1-phosphate adenylyltransferase [Rhodovastum atsumiense]|uniref:Bifunctional protein HldE n=2 Tax=Rhodovastum atsumiense TaxID=504468 RepID=A0A5M6ILY5_9PROT|nr:D-glycero-beta-D-manno-heptose 1-phosphate adenylyltransferase [Rhodovastum atsumiense]